LISNWFSSLLQFFFNLTNNYGLAIILLTLTYRLVLLPLTWTQRKSMVKMKEVAPLQKEIQEKYKDNPQEANKRIMELYKKHNVSPFGGCLLALLQLPIGIILFSVLRKVDYAGYAFLWIKDLTRPDPILAIISGGISYLQMSMETTESNKTSAITFPLFITMMGMTLASGLSLYIVSTYLLSYVETLVMNRMIKGNQVRVEEEKNND